MNASYDKVADWYTTQVRTEPTGAGSWAFPALLDLVGNVKRQYLCDLGCGEGRIARLVAQQGAHVLGIDQSVELIRLAKEHEDREPLGIHYQVGDAQSLDQIADAYFDGVVCGLALMDIPNIAATFRAVQRVLKADGWFVFLIIHPCFASPHARLETLSSGESYWQIRSYFPEGFWSTQQGGTLCSQVGAHHRTLSTYLNTLIQAGFIFEQLVEPQAPPERGEHNSAHKIVPLLLLVRCRKT